MVSTNSQLGNGGAITLLTAGGDITTADLFASSDGTGTGGILSSLLPKEKVRSTQQLQVSLPILRRKGRAMELSTVGGNIITSNLNSFTLYGDGDGGNIKVSVTGGTGAIDTTNGSVNAYSVGGKGGAIEPQLLAVT